MLIYLSLHSVDLTVARGHRISLLNVEKYFQLMHVTWEERKAQYDRDLFGTRRGWWKFLAPIPVRTDDTNDPTP